MRTGALLLCAFFLACSSSDASDDSDVNDAAIDQTADQTTSDTGAKDTSTADVTPLDASTDVASSDVTTADVSKDAPDDAIEDAPEDAPNDAIVTLDAGGCTNDGQCGQGSYCAKANGDCNGIGQCLLEPFACQQIYFPVCACNNMTYTNSCWAEKAGENVAYTGACE